MQKSFNKIFLFKIAKSFCRVNPDHFCYVYGELIISKKIYSLTESLTMAYFFILKSRTLTKIKKGLGMYFVKDIEEPWTLGL